MIARWLPKRKKSLCTPVGGGIARNLSSNVPLAARGMSPGMRHAQMFAANRKMFSHQ
jgi:hypothetical protein